MHCPTWKQIEEAIRRLNKDEWPFMWMYRTENPYEDDVPDFEIMGGAGHYVIGAKPPGETHELFYTDDSHGVERIELWLSDQGASVEASKVCFDIAEVLNMTKYYCESGTLYPGVEWT